MRKLIGLALLALVAFSIPTPASAAWRGGWGWGGGWGGAGWGWHGNWGWRTGWGWPGYGGAYWGVYPAWYPGYAYNYPYVNPYYYPYTIYRYATYPAAVYAPTTYFGPSSYAQPLAAPQIVEQRPFIVFFDFDKSELTPAARQILNQAIADARRGDVTHVQITGYTDAAGTVDYNLGLSRRRAETVRAYMASHGVAGDEISVGWLGKDHQRVKTPDGVREPQNRRVEISVAAPNTVQNEPPRPMPRRPGMKTSATMPPNLIVASAKGGDCREVPTADGQNHAMMCHQADGTWKTVR